MIALVSTQMLGICLCPSVSGENLLKIEPLSSE